MSSSSTRRKKRKVGEDNVVVFEYTGQPRHAPRDVVSARFHSSVVEVGSHAFFGCNRLMEVVLNEGLQTIGSMTFQRCSSLERITLPSTITRVGPCAFRWCTNLKGAFLNEGLVEIHNGAFHGCALESIHLPSTVTNIGTSAFGKCSKLREVVLNDGLQKIGNRAFEFSGGRTLESITIPSTVTEIGNKAFHSCTRLREMGLHEKIQTLQVDAFDGCTSLLNCCFPSLSTRLEALGHYQTKVFSKIDRLSVGSAIERRGSDIIVSTAKLREVHGWFGVKLYPQLIAKSIVHCEMKEFTSLFELALWKAKLDQEEGVINPRNRKLYRTNVPGPVKYTIIQYLYPAEQYRVWYEDGAILARFFHRLNSV